MVLETQFTQSGVNNDNEPDDDDSANQSDNDNNNSCNNDESDENQTDGDDSSDEDESGSDDDDDDDDDSDDDGSDDDDDSEDESGSGSGSDDSDDDDDDDSDDSDDSSSSKKKKKKGKKGKETDEFSKLSPSDARRVTINEIQKVSEKLSWLLSDLHTQFKPNGVSKVDGTNDYAPLGYSIFSNSNQNNNNNNKMITKPSERRPLLMLSPNKPNIANNNPNLTNQSINNNINQFTNNNNNNPNNIQSFGKPNVEIYYASDNNNSNNKPPISSPIRHKDGTSIDRGAGGLYLFPSYAQPPSAAQIKGLYRNYSDKEREMIQRNQMYQNNGNNQINGGSSGSVWEDTEFSNEFIQASRAQRSGQKRKWNVKPPKRLVNRLTNNRNGNNNNNNNNNNNYGKVNLYDNEIDDNIEETPETFEDLYKHFDEKIRLQKQSSIQQLKQSLQNRGKRVSNMFDKKKQYAKVPNYNNKNKWKKNEKNSSGINDMNGLDSRNDIDIKQTENKLLEKAATLLLGADDDENSDAKQKGLFTKLQINKNRGRSKKFDNEKYGIVRADSPDSLQDKIERKMESQNGNRTATFV